MVIILGASRLCLAQNVNSRGIWISNEELKAIPTSGPAWQYLKSRADQPSGIPRLSNQNDPENVQVLAKALVYARTGVESYRTQVIASCMAAMQTERGGRTLALARELAAYVISADLVGLPEADDAYFRAWLKDVRKEVLSGKTLVSTHEVRPNNWGTQAGASRAAIAAYLQEDSELARCAKIFRGWLGDRSSYSKFEYKDPSWQADPLLPVGINPPGATILGYSVDGALPEELRRSGEFIWPPPKQNYVYTALEGALGQAMILHRAGYDVWNWQDQALLRAYRWLHEQANFPAVGNDTWQPHVINCYYGTRFPAPVPAVPGKSVGWTEWTHGYPAAIQTGIHGVVKNAMSDYEVIEAAIELKVGSETRYSAVTNVNGCFDIVNAASGTYTISCSTPGFEDWSEEVTLETGKQIFARRIRLQPDFSDTTPPEPPLNLHLVQE